MTIFGKGDCEQGRNYHEGGFWHRERVLQSCSRMRYEVQLLLGHNSLNITYVGGEDEKVEL